MRKKISNNVESTNVYNGFLQINLCVTKWVLNYYYFFKELITEIK